MAKYKDIYGNVFEVGDPSLNPSLVRGRTLVPDTTPLSADVRLPEGVSLPYQSSTLTASDFLNLPDIKPPEKRPDGTPYNALVANGQAQIDAYGKTGTTGTPATAPDAITTLAEKYFASQEKPPSGADTFRDIYGYSVQDAATREAEAQHEANRRLARVNDAKARLSGIQAELQTIVADRDAQNLQLVENAKGGLVTTSFLNAQQQEINRQAAIKALPIQSRALVAQAEIQQLQGEAEFAQSTLKSAQNKLDMAFDLVKEDNKNAWEYKKEQQKEMFKFLTEGQKAILNALQRKEDQNGRASEITVQDAHNIMSQLFTSGNIELANEVFKLPQPNEKSTDADRQNYRNSVAAIQARAKPKIDITATGGSVEEFTLLYGRTPNSLAELNAFTQARAEAGRKPTGVGVFSDTQLNKGASNAGLPITDFRGLDSDVQNYFVNLTPTQASDLRTTLVQVKSGDMDAEEAKDYISNKGYIPVVEQFLSELIDSVIPQKETGFWSKAWNTVVKLFE